MILAMFAALAVQADNLECDRIASHPSGAGLPREVIRPGDKVAISFQWLDGPFGTKDIPRECITRLEVSGPAELLRDGSVRILDDARSGDELVVSMRIGTKERRQTFPITGRDEQTLAGVWRESRRENCEGRRIAELVFTLSGAFSYTVPEQMVETMVTGSGRYRWDPATGALDMGGEDRFYWHGRAVRTPDGLVIEGINPTGFQNGPDMPVCRIILSGG